MRSERHLFLRSLCEILGECFETKNFSEGVKLPKKNTEVLKQSPMNAYSNQKNPLSTLIFIFYNYTWLPFFRFTLLFVTSTSMPFMSLFNFHNIEY